MNHHPTPKDRCRSPGPCRVLLPRVMASGREWLRRWCTTLQVSGIDGCAHPPFTLVSVSAGQAQCCDEEGCCHLVIPVQCQVRDGRGCLHTGHGQITLQVRMHRDCCCEEGWRYQWLALPCVRLACQPPCSQDLCFEGAFEVVAEVYLIKWEACSLGDNCRPACPPLPLYPPPCHWERS